jgi:hypothetical protein
MKNLVLVIGLVLLIGCGDRSWKVVELDSPASRGSVEPFLAVTDDAVWMSWLQKTTDGHVLKLARWDGEWSESKTIAADVPFFVNWADFPSILPLAGNRIVAQWLQKMGEGTYAYFVMTSISNDQGKTWSEPVPAHLDRTMNEHGFASLIDEGEGDSSIIWLDSRNIKGDHHEASGAMALMYSRVNSGSEQILDERVCDCCQTAAVRTNDGLFVAYRDRSEKEIRDISYLRFSGKEWSKPQTLHPDGWHIEGCPVNGPAVDASGDLVAVAWYTGANDEGRVRLAFSDNSGKSFHPPVQIDEGNPSGRVDVVLMEDGSAVVSWLENLKDQGAEIRIRQVFPDGRKGEALTVADTLQARASGFPRIARRGKDLLIAWTHAGEDSQIRIARIDR